MHGRATLCALSYFMHEIVTLCKEILQYWKGRKIDPGHHGVYIGELQFRTLLQ